MKYTDRYDWLFKYVRDNPGLTKAEMVVPHCPYSTLREDLQFLVRRGNIRIDEKRYYANVSFCTTCRSDSFDGESTPVVGTTHQHQKDEGCATAPSSHEGAELTPLEQSIVEAMEEAARGNR